jgi:hypothetical protein
VSEATGTPRLAPRVGGPPARTAEADDALELEAGRHFAALGRRGQHGAGRGRGGGDTRLFCCRVGPLRARRRAAPAGTPPSSPAPRSAHITLRRPPPLRPLFCTPVHRPTRCTPAPAVPGAAGGVRNTRPARRAPPLQRTHSARSEPSPRAAARNERQHGVLCGVPPDGRPLPRHRAHLARGREPLWRRESALNAPPPRGTAHADALPLPCPLPPPPPARVPLRRARQSA